jgi:chromosome transmission fidelity protein 4
VLTYTPDGRRIVTGGSNSAIRVYTVGEDGEPKTIDDGVDGNLGVVATVCRTSVRGAARD